MMALLAIVFLFTLDKPRFTGLEWHQTLKIEAVPPAWSRVGADWGCGGADYLDPTHLVADQQLPDFARANDRITFPLSSAETKNVLGV